jgi:Nif-specific regulatory protein
MLKVSLDRDRLETLININTLINSQYTDITVLLTRILESATKLSSGLASSLLLVNPKNNKLYFEIALGTKGKEIQRYSLAMGEGIAGWVAQHNTSLIVNDTDADKRFKAEISRQIGYPTKSILAVPMRLKDRCIGVIEILNKQDGQDFDDEDLQWLEIFATQAAIAIQNARAYQRVQEEVLVLQDQLRVDQGFHTFVCASKAMADKIAIAEKAAETQSPVLLLGESGVGKELFAEQIHLKSPRSAKPFIRVNCAALPESLLESELFGHVKGAFTDATSDRRGRFELADGGTLFLDEIGDLPLTIQAKLLRVLQQQTFEKLGSSQTIHVDVRIIAATNQDIDTLVREQKFRTDLYYRLNVLPIHIPPLRLRKEDIPELTDFFLTRICRQNEKKLQGFSPEAMEKLLSYSWPGNVRELKNVVERAAVLTAENDIIRPQALFPDNRSLTNRDEYRGMDLKHAVNLFKKNFITHVLQNSGWNQTRAAKYLGIQRTYLSRLIKDLEISKV